MYSSTGNKAGLKQKVIIMTSLSGFGSDFEILVSKAAAKKIMCDIELPKMGWQVDILLKKDDYGFSCVLMLQNISGQYVICCANVSRQHWQQFFNTNLCGLLK